MRVSEEESKRAKRGRTLSAPSGSLDEDQEEDFDKEDLVSKIPPASEVISLIESHRKGVRAHGLLQFVLWRETLKKVEKDNHRDPTGKKCVKNRLRRTTII